MTKPHASGPRYVRERRNHQEIIDRAEKQERRRSTKVHRDPPLIEDGFLVEPEPDERVPYFGWESMRDLWVRAENAPISHRAAVIGCLGAVAVILAVLALLIAAPRPAAGTAIPTALRDDGHPSDVSAPTERVRASGNLARQLTGAPLGPDARLRATFDAPPSPSATPVPSPTGGVSGSYTASATWCAPKGDKCHGWGGHAKLAAVFSFTSGDKPYRVLVEHGSRRVLVTVVSHCACFGDRSYIDLSPYSFSRLAPLSRGRIDVVVTDVAGIKLPPTDTE